MHNFDLPVYLQNFLKEKKQQEHSTKSKHEKKHYQTYNPWLKYFMHYILKKNSPELSVTLICPFISPFFWGGKEQEKLPNPVVHSLNSSHPF